MSILGKGDLGSRRASGAHMFRELRKWLLSNHHEASTSEQEGNEMSIKCDKFIVSGVVQGVGFRYHTAHQGLTLSLTGYAKNLSSGDVEVIACGEPDQVDALHEWLKEGPRTASVNHVERLECITNKHYRGFEIL